MRICGDADRLPYRAGPNFEASADSNGDDTARGNYVWLFTRHYFSVCHAQRCHRPHHLAHSRLQSRHVPRSVCFCERSVAEVFESNMLSFRNPDLRQRAGSQCAHQIMG